MYPPGGPAPADWTLPRPEYPEAWATRSVKAEALVVCGLRAGIASWS